MATITETTASLRVITTDGEFVSEVHYRDEWTAWEMLTLAEAQLNPGQVLQLIHQDRVLAEVIEDLDGPPF